MLQKRNRSSRGFTLLAALLLVLLISALAVALMYSVNSERKISSADQEQNLARYAAEAAMEKMTADVGILYTTMQAPQVSDISALGGAANQPSIPGVNFLSYTISATPDPKQPTMPAAVTKTITSGPNDGLYAETIPVNMDVIATRSASGSEVHVQRTAEVALIPVFQFGVFSDSDLSFFPGPAFDFNGRVFTNGNLFLAAQDGPLSFHSKLSTAGDVVRKVLVNDGDATPRANKVLIPTAPAGCDGGVVSPTPIPAPTTTSTYCMDLLQGYSSLQAGDPYKGNTESSTWISTVHGIFKDQLMTRHEGVKQLNLPFVGSGSNLAPWEIIKRPPNNGAVDKAATSREYTMAQIRVLLDDLQADLPGGPQAGDVHLDDLTDPYLNTGITVDGVEQNNFQLGVNGGRHIRERPRAHRRQLGHRA